MSEWEKLIHMLKTETCMETGRTKYFRMMRKIWGPLTEEQRRELIKRSRSFAARRFR